MEPKERDKYDQEVFEKVAEVPPQSEEIMIGGSRMARLGDRFIAIILDTFLIGAGYAVIGMFVSSKFGGVTKGGFSIEGKPALITIGLTLIFGFLYYWILEGLFGATLGKAIIGIKVLKRDGTRSDLRSSLIRNLLRIIDGLGVYLVGFFIALFSKFSQRLGDHLANTLVVEKRTGKAIKGMLVILWIVAIGGGIWFAYVIHSRTPKPVITQSPPPPSESTVTAPVVVSGDLKIINFKFTQSKDGPIRPEAPYKPEDKVYVNFDVIGYTTDEEGRAHVLITIVPLDPSGLSLYAPYKLKVYERVPKAGEPVNGSFNFDLPYYAPGGKYNIHIKVHDVIKNTDSELKQPFMVEASPVSPSTRLEIRDFLFSLSKGGPPVKNPVIQPGGTLYSTCHVSGMQFREDRPDVQISLKVIGPKGEIIFENPNFLSIHETRFYRPPTFFTIISAWITLPSEAPKGRYIWKYIMTDRIGNEKVDYEANFEIKE